MKCASLVSGSKANSFYVENDKDALLIDAGLSLPKVELTLQNLNINKNKLRGILLTHEHEDHIRHLKRIAHILKLPVYLTKESYEKSGISLDDFCFIKDGDDLEFGSIHVNAFKVLHDSVMCLGFTLTSNNKKIFYASDIGSFNDTILQKAENADFIGIEANYEPKMLARCHYPQYLKDRISSGAGHLSNNEAARFVRYASGVNTKQVMFLHISENSNCRSYIEKMIDSDLHHSIPEVRYCITHRNQHTKLIVV